MLALRRLRPSSRGRILAPPLPENRRNGTRGVVLCRRGLAEAPLRRDGRSKRCAAQHREVLPGFIALNSTGIPTSGYLPAKYAPFGVTTAATGLATLSHPDGATRFSDRWNLLHLLDTNRVSGGLAKKSLDMNDFYDQSKAL